MSRYQIPVRANVRALFPKTTAYVWWDTPLQTFAAHVEGIGGPADGDHMAVRIGTMPGALPTVHALHARLWPWAMISDTILAQLAHDQAARTRKEEAP